ncbi:leucine-rich repeat-containing protein 57-like [Nematostella vectensis]|uniref:leucine-rich repeat-containing protein 57-like n=1 Tax=Nematostella vectensis TaxID=45351 RepID=UPI0020776BB5|nr:leucine-rich repeat-containing protein 57-like [Nematostella vectensis]
MESTKATSDIPEKGTVDFLIQSSKNLNSLDLSFQNLSNFPTGLLELTQLEYLYLKGSQISALPEEFFRKLINLVWLDLRDNQLENLPNSIGEHGRLKTLLLQGNKLKILPLELGLLNSLSAISLSGNPIEDPPEDVIKEGVTNIQVFLLKKLGFQEVEVKGDNESIDSDSDFEECIPLRDAKKRNKTPLKNRCRTPNNEDKDVGFRATAGADPETLPPRASVSSPVEFRPLLPPAASTHPAIYGSWLGGNPNFYIHKPWKTGTFLTRTKVNGKSQNIHSA